MTTSYYAPFTLNDTVNMAAVLSYTVAVICKRTLLLQLLQESTYFVFRIYVRPSVQQRSGDICVTVSTCIVKRSPIILIESKRGIEDEMK